MSLPWRDLQRTEGPAMPTAPGWAARTVTSWAAPTPRVQTWVAEVDMGGPHYTVTVANAPSAPKG